MVILLELFTVNSCVWCEQMEVYCTLMVIVLQPHV